MFEVEAKVASECEDDSGDLLYPCRAKTCLFRSSISDAVSCALVLACSGLAGGSGKRGLEKLTEAGPLPLAIAILDGTRPCGTYDGGEGAGAAHISGCG